MEVTDADKLAEIRREQKLRRRIYPRWIAEGKLPEATANHRVAIMAAIEWDYAVKTGELRGLFDAPPELTVAET